MHMRRCLSRRRTRSRTKIMRGALDIVIWGFSDWQGNVRQGDEVELSKSWAKASGWALMHCYTNHLGWGRIFYPLPLCELWQILCICAVCMTFARRWERDTQSGGWHAGKCAMNGMTFERVMRGRICRIHLRRATSDATVEWSLKELLLLGLLETCTRRGRWVDKSRQDNEICIEKIGIAVRGYLKHNCSPVRSIIVHRQRIEKSCCWQALKWTSYHHAFSPCSNALATSDVIGVHCRTVWSRSK